MNTENIESAEQGKAAALSSAALARRRMLLKGLGKGSAALAVVVPINTLAATTIIGGTKLCTVSGVQSNIGSHPTDGTVCSGYTPGHYAVLTNWPGYAPGNNPPTTATATNTVDGITFTDSSEFREVFGGGSNNKLLNILTSAPTSDEAVWVTALLNAIKNPPTFNFPYTPSQVRAFYTGGGTLADQALAFFKGYMQTVA